MRRPNSFRRSDVTRAIKAAKAAGVTVKQIEVDPAGKIVIVADVNGQLPSVLKVNEWDRDLCD